LWLSVDWQHERCTKALLQQDFCVAVAAPSATPCLAQPAHWQAAISGCETVNSKAANMVAVRVIMKSARLPQQVNASCGAGEKIAGLSV
jgi:hypothetical protein